MDNPTTQSQMNLYTGPYAMYGISLDVKEDNGELVAAIGGVPDGFEIKLQPTGQHTFRMVGGPLDGATAVFQLDESGLAQTLRCGHFEIPRLPSGAPQPEPVERLQLPPMPMDDARQAAFDQLLQSVMNKKDGTWIEYQLPYPKHEFIRYASGQDAVIFHGSNNRQIDQFLPVRKSFELRDESGRGNLQAVYGTHDGVWAMFFAVVDRSRLEGSIRNGVMTVHNRAGERLDLYNFSVNQEQLADRPWTQGALYFLPRQPFRRLFLAGDALSNEWASETPVKPIARLSLEPQEFPFLDQIGGHDDSIFIRSAKLLEVVQAAVTSAREQAHGLELKLAWSESFSGQLDEYLRLQRELMPAAQFKLEVAGDGESARLEAILPAAVRQVFINAIQEKLI